MKKLNMLLAAALLGGAAMMPAGAAQAASIQLDNGGISVQYGDRYSRGRLIVRPEAVDQDSRVTLIGRDLPPFARLLVSAGRNPDRLRTVRAVRTDANGRVFLRVDVPEWARPGRPLFFALTTPGGRVLAQARPVRVLDAGEYDNGGNVRINVTGTLLDASATCPRLAGDDGRIYALAGNTREFDTGDRVRVTGELADVSTCNQRRTIDVERIREAD